MNDSVDDIIFTRSTLYTTFKLVDGHRSRDRTNGVIAKQKKKNYRIKIGGFNTSTNQIYAWRASSGATSGVGKEKKDKLHQQWRARATPTDENRLWPADRPSSGGCCCWWWCRRQSNRAEIVQRKETTSLSGRVNVLLVGGGGLLCPGRKAWNSTGGLNPRVSLSSGTASGSRLGQQGFWGGLKIKVWF